MTIAQAFELALQHHQAGQLAEAEAIYRQILAAEPRHAATLHFLGVVAHQVGRSEVAVDLIRQAIALAPDVPTFHSNLGESYRAARQFDRAIAAYRQAIALKPDYPEAHSNLGVALWARGSFDEAIASCRQAIAFQPSLPEAHYNLGHALHGEGQLEDAIAAYRQAITLRPNSPEALYALGVALQANCQLEEAIAAYHQAIALQPNYPEAHNNLGVALRDRGHLKEAIAAYRHAIALQPNLAEVHSNLGEAFRAHGQLDQAIASCRQAIALQPNYPEAHSNLGNSLAASGHFDEAIAEQQRALAIKPDLASAHCNLGNALREAGQVDRALEVLRNAVARWPGDPEMHSFLILTLLHQPGEFGIALRETCRQWGERHGAPLGECVPAHGNSVDPRRRLRVGYVSADFSSHVVSRFLTPLLEGHDHVEFEICCYASVRRPDQVTERLKKTADLWRNVVGFTDEKLAAQIRADAIDILVDLTMHSAGNRLLAFARKPAPVQVAWLGHPGSTGLRAVDYRLTDASMDPAGSEWADSVENAVRLPDSWFCYDPLEEFPPPGELPARKAGYVTFGSLNSFPKMNEAVVRRWAAVLSAVAGSKLLMRCPEGEAQTRLRRLFAAHGIGSERMELVSWLSAPAEFLQLYQRIDIGLDPFPFNGGTTTCEALWMGVPVLTVPGSAAVSRIGLSILSAAGLANFVAETEEEFVFLAVRLATDLDLLANLRSTLRQRMKTSAYMDGPRFARNVEQAYREMWRQWCEKQTAKFSRP